MNNENEINQEKIAAIIEYSFNEIAKKNEGVSKEAIVGHIANKIMEELKDDNIENSTD